VNSQDPLHSVKSNPKAKLFPWQKDSGSLSQENNSSSSPTEEPREKSRLESEKKGPDSSDQPKNRWDPNPKVTKTPAPKLLPIENRHVSPSNSNCERLNHQKALENSNQSKAVIVQNQNSPSGVSPRAIQIQSPRDHRSREQ